MSRFIRVASFMRRSESKNTLRCYQERTISLRKAKTSRG